MNTMNKQIEEITSIVGDCRSVSDEECDKHYKCAECKAVRVYNAGYRKASDVAREIFEEIEKIFADVQVDRCLERLGCSYIAKNEKTIEQKFAELKKQYESEVANDANADT